MAHTNALDRNIRRYLSDGRQTSAFRAAYPEVLETRGANRNLAGFAFSSAIAIGYFEEAFDLIPSAAPDFGNEELFAQLAELLVTCGHAQMLRDMGAFDLFLQNSLKYQSLFSILLRACMQLAHQEPDGDGIDPIVDFAATSLARSSNPNVTSISLQLIAKRHGAKTIDDLHGRYGSNFKRICDSVPFKTTLLQTRFWETVIDDKCLVDLDRAQLFPENNHVPRLGIGVGRLQTENTGNGGGTPLTLNKADLQRGMQRTIDTARNFVFSDPQTQRKFEYLKSLSINPVCVVSTGRVGTKALHQLLSHSETSTSFHYFQQHWENMDLNALFYSMFCEKDNSLILEKCLSRFVDDRFAEMVYCSRNGTTPVIVNHLDSVLAVLYLAIFPETRILYAFRDPQKTLISLAFKRQFSFRQLRNLRFEFQPGNQLFHCRRDTTLSLVEECTWYMYATEMLGLSLKENVSASQYMELDMEELFTHSRASFSKLLAFLDDSSIDFSTCKRVYSKPINQKQHYGLDGSPEEIAESGDVFSQTWAQLQQTGSIQGN